jgi:hypothetical protein
VPAPAPAAADKDSTSPDVGIGEETLKSGGITEIAVLVLNMIITIDSDMCFGIL